MQLRGLWPVCPGGIAKPAAASRLAGLRVLPYCTRSMVRNFSIT